MLDLFAVAHVNKVEALMLAVLMQLVVMVLAARLGGWLFSRLGQPIVVGEIAAGLLLGPSAFGRLSPDLINTVFPTTLVPIFQTLGQLGLIFLMFMIGMEFEFGHLRKLGRTAAGVGFAGMVLPFTLALILGWAMYPQANRDWLEQQQQQQQQQQTAAKSNVSAQTSPSSATASEPAPLNYVGFVLFMATACTVTAIPILGRIMIELGINRTALGALTISAAAMDDALIWILLATVAAIVKGDFDPIVVAQTLGLTIAFAASMWLIVRPLAIRQISRLLHPTEGSLALVPMSLCVLAIFSVAMLSNWIGIFSIIGPFVLGSILWDQHEFREAFNVRAREFVTAVLLPVFFTYTGLRTNIGLLNSAEAWMWCGLVCLAAMSGKLLGCGLAARLGGLSWPETGCVAVMMNTRALMGLIAINVGRELGVIPDTVFCMLIIMAVLTTFMCSPLLKLLLPYCQLDRPGGTQPAPTPAVLAAEV